MTIADCNFPVSQNIVEITEEIGIKQRVIAKRAGFSSQQLTDMIKWRRLIKISDIPKLANALNVSPNDLFLLERQSKE